MNHPWTVPPVDDPLDPLEYEATAAAEAWIDSEECHCPEIRHGWQGCEEPRDPLLEQYAKGTWPVCSACYGGEH